MLERLQLVVAHKIILLYVYRETPNMISTQNKNCSLPRSPQHLAALQQQLVKYRIPALHQQLRLLVVVEDPPILALHQVLRQHPRQPVLLNLPHVLLAPRKRQHLLSLDDDPAVGRRCLKQFLLSVFHTFLNMGYCTLVSSRVFTCSNRCDFFHGKGRPNDPKFLSKSRHSFKQSKHPLRNILLRLFRCSCRIFYLSYSIPCLWYFKDPAILVQ